MNNKKILALILAFTMIFSSISTVFADTTATIGADAEALKTIGVLKGDTTEGVTSAYLAKTTTRIQAAIMFLRLKGLEDEAMAFTGTTNFADANTMTWADGKAIMAYLKANPQLGWIGADAGKFNPFETVTAQQYYKVMLEALGYKQTTAEVVGDFAWNDVMTFAASKGIAKVANVDKLTNNDLAIATIEGLKANVKGTETTLATSMVDAGMINKAAAVAAGLYEEVVTTDAELDTVIATANNKVEIGFTAAVEKAFAENKANFKIFVKGTTTELEVISAELASDPSYVVLTTAAQTGGTAYTLNVGTQKMNFAGAAKSAGVPKIDSVKAIDTNTVEVVFTTAVDRASAENVENYVLNNNATVKSAELWASQDDTRKTVKLTTEGVANSKVYSLKIQNVKSADQSVMTAATKSFTGITDTKAPVIDGAIEVQNNQRIIVKFDDARGIDKATAENKENWTIKDYEGNTLNIVSLTAKDLDGDNYSKYDAVEVATDTMTSGKKYTVTISNLADASVSKNVISKELTKSFTGKAADKTAPTVVSAVALSDTAIKVVFNDQNRLDATTLTDINNYKFAKDIEVTSAKILRPTKPDLTLGKTVILTTTAMNEDIKSYALSITGIADEFGNVIKTYNKTISYKAEDVTAPYVKSAVWVDLNTVKLTFDDTLDSVTAEDAANYSLNNNIGVVTKAKISGNDSDLYKVVTLTVPTMDENKKYTITINGVEDLLGNATVNAKAYFTSQRDGMDTTRPTIVSADVVSKEEIKVTFDEKVKLNGAAVMTVRYDSNSDGSITGADATVTYAQRGALLDDKTTIVFESNNTAVTGNTENEFRIESISNVSDLANNKYVVNTDDYETFYGSDADNEAATVDSIEQVDPLTIVVMFDKPITVDAANSFAGFTATVDVDGDDTNDAESTLTLKSSSVLVYDKEYKFDLNNHVKDYMGLGVTDTDGSTTNIIAGIEDEDKPVIEYVEAINTRKLQVHYNEKLSFEGSYKIYEDGKTTPVSGITVTASLDSDDATVVNVALSSALTANKVYQIKPASAAKDLAGNKADTADVEFSFVGSTIVPFDYVSGVTVVDADTIRVYANTDLGTSISVKNEAGVEIAAGAATYPKATDHTFVQVNLSEPMVDGEKYTVDVNIAGVAAYTFTGKVDDGGLEIDANGAITFSGNDFDDYVVKVVYQNAGTFTELFVRPTGTEFNATSEMYVYADGTNVTLADVLANSTEYTISVYRTTGIADGTILGTEADWDAYKALVDGNIDSTPLYTTKIAD